MQMELDGEDLPLEVSILGVNEFGLESGNALVVEGRVIPWLQDSIEEDVWRSWDITYRDVLILNADNEPVATYNLTTNDLAVSARYQELADLLRAEAQGTEPARR